MHTCSSAHCSMAEVNLLTNASYYQMNENKNMLKACRSSRRYCTFKYLIEVVFNFTAEEKKC